MRIIAPLLCGLIFGAGLLISGMVQPAKVLGFLDIFGAWDPSLAVVMAAALLILAIAPSPVAVIIAYLAFAGTSFTIAMLIASGWGEVLHLRELAVGSAAINSICGIGSFLMPFGWGATRDATGGFAVGFVALTVFTIGSAALTLRIRAVVRGRPSAAAIGVAVPA